ncbi:MAG: hypothetical protein K6B67_07645, partial [Lachnospiraceae bacterium]|nr:hypothetical protein [Lachnospiraceae bacterium]
KSAEIYKNFSSKIDRYLNTKKTVQHTFELSVLKQLNSLLLINSYKIFNLWSHRPLTNDTHQGDSQ